MPWFWGSSSRKDDDEYSDESYDSEELYSDEESEDDSSSESDEEEDHSAQDASNKDKDSNINNDSSKELAETTLSEQQQLVPESQSEASFTAAAEELDLPSSSTSSQSEGIVTENNRESLVPEETLPVQTNSLVDESSSSSKNEPADKEQQEEEEQVTSLSEKQSLLVLAAEHDRVDILQAILSESTPDDRQHLLQGHNSVPPLHIAVSYGSMNATNCLLRMGADPSIVPDVKQQQQQQATADGSPPVEIAHKHRYDGLSAWHVVFGTSSQVSAFEIAPSKREGLRHAFTAEALRCIGSDEADRLQQLLSAGMPNDIDIGGKMLYDWAVEMGALHCEEVLRPSQQEPQTTSSAVLDRPPCDDSENAVSHLLNRLDELESLSRALSTCLDNLGEEVAVCSGLLLVGSGASALASHVRSLKTNKEQKQEELVRYMDAWDNSEDELAYWVREAGPEGAKIASQIMTPKKTEDHTQEAQQLRAQIAASENKIRMLRVSIADLSDENARNLAEVERRGLSGGINLVRGLREEIRDIEFQLNEAKSGDAECRTKISLIQSKVRTNGKAPVQSTGLPSYDEVVETKTAGGLSSSETDDHEAMRANFEDGGEKSSERISHGQSTALAIRDSKRGFFPLSLWQILMRIIGIREETATFQRSNSRGQPALIV